MPWRQVYLPGGGGGGGTHGGSQELSITDRLGSQGLVIAESNLAIVDDGFISFGSPETIAEISDLIQLLYRDFETAPGPTIAHQFRIADIAAEINAGQTDPMALIFTSPESLAAQAELAKLIMAIQDTNATPTDLYSLLTRAPESNAAQSELSFIVFARPETNAAQTESQKFTSLIQETLAGQIEASSLLTRIAETIAAISETAQKFVILSPDSNATQTELQRLTTAIQETNATAAEANQLRSSIADSNVVPTDVYLLTATVSSPDSNASPTDSIKATFASPDSNATQTEDNKLSTAIGDSQATATEAHQVKATSSEMIAAGGVGGGLSHDDEIAADSPWLWYKMNEASGVADDAGSGNNDGTVSGTVTRDQPPLYTGSGKAYDFGGGQILGPGSIIPAASSWTIEFEIEPDAINSNRAVCTTNSNLIYSALFFQEGTLRVKLTNAELVVSGGPHIAAGGKYYVQLRQNRSGSTFDGVANNDIELRINGVAVGTTGAFANDWNTEALIIGTLVGQATWDGRIDNFRIFRSCLTATRLDAHYNARNSVGGEAAADSSKLTIISREARTYHRNILAKNPLVYLRMGESSGTVLQDETANDRDFQIGGGTLGAAGAIVGWGNTALEMDGTDDYAYNAVWNPFVGIRTLAGWLTAVL